MSKLFLGAIMIITFEEEFSLKSVTEVIEKMESTKEAINFYFSCNGGSVSCSEILLDYINNHPKKNITLITNGVIQSCAMTFVILAKCKKRVLESTQGMIHLYKLILHNGKECPNRGKYKEMYRITARSNDVLFDIYKDAGVDDKSLERFKKGEDVYFDYIECKNIFLNACGD
jgi:ATP-dependent protease ClpP protease subunit